MPIVHLGLQRGFAPDLAPDTPGILADSNQIYPTLAGYRPFPALALESSGGPLPDGGCYGACFEQDASDAGRALFMATAHRLYSFQPGGGFSDVSGGQNFTGPAAMAGYRSPRWRWTMYGGDLIVLNPADAPQKLGFPYRAAAPLGGNPPHGALAATVGDFLFIFDSAGNDWNCSAIGNDASWSPDIGTQAANGVLGDTPGPIVGAHALGSNQLLVYKQRAVYLGSYVGPPVIWSFDRLAADAGAVCQEAVVNHGGVQVFMGLENFYTCDGTAPRVLPNPVQEWFFGQSLDFAHAVNVWGLWDRGRNLVIWFYPSLAANPPGSLDRYLCWHPPTNRWTTGANANPIAAPMVAPVNPDGSITYAAGAPLGLAAVLGDGNLYSFSAGPAAAWLTTGDFGDAMRYSLLRGVRPRFASYPAGDGARLTPCYRYNLGDTQYANADAPLSSYGWFSVRQSARYHALRLTITAPCEVIAMDIDWSMQGTR